jgi:subtilase family serine protease
MTLPMTIQSARSRTTASRLAVATTLCLLAAMPALAAPQARITTPVDNSSRTTLTGTVSPRAIPSLDTGAVPGSTKLTGITLVFSRTAEQQTVLDALVAAQQNPASAQYHQWLTPQQFGAQFGAAASDISAVEAWLQQQGFSIDSVANSRDRINFSGTATQVESAFGAPLHYFKTNTGTAFTPASELTVPSAIASAVLTVTNLSSFRPHSHVKFHPAISDKPNFTSGQTGSFFLDPDDVATIYDINAAYNAGYTGAGQSIAVMGQSEIVPADITNFQTALGLTANPPTQILVPSTGTAAISSGDEAESDLDLEYTSTIAKGATIYFVYTGNSTNSNGVFTSLQYAVTNKTAPIISISYGDCEIDLGSANYTQLNAILQQAATQGQTVIAAAGDSGSTDCYGETGTGLSNATLESLAVDFPGSSQYVTSMGGTEFPAADVAAGNTTYWTTSSTTDVLSSAKSYIPEQVWNDDYIEYEAGSTSPLSSGGGGVSIYTTRPTWQTGVSGIETGFYRLVPDISLAASPNYPGYLYCSSDTETGVTGSCTHGFRDVNSTYLTVAGGTSFDAPIFAGMLAIINQSHGVTTGQGVVNPILYTLASNATTYASAFHDITNGGNECAASTVYCTTAGASEYYATTGYDEASGLGSVDLYNLISAWPAVTAPTNNRGSFTVSAAALTVATGSSASTTVTVTPSSGYTGTIAWSLTASPALANACYTLSNVSVTGTSAVTTSLTVSATSTGCTAAQLTGTGTHPFASTTTIKSSNHPPSHMPFGPAPTTVAAAALLAGIFFTRRSRRLGTFLAIALLAAAGFAVTGCSNADSTNAGTGSTTTTTTTSSTNATEGAYTLTLTGTDTATTTITASTTFALTIN